MNAILEAVWFFAPVGLANMAPVPAAKIPFLKIPIDGGKEFNGKRIFGDHKTVRGFVAGFILALLGTYLQVYLFENVEWFRELSIINYSTLNVWLWAALSTVGALGGDAVESFFKRQLDRPPGKAWFPFDQIDFIIGGLIMLSLASSITTAQIITIFLVFFLLHPIVTTIGYLLKLKDSPI